jgi:hypothetical protein
LSWGWRLPVILVDRATLANSDEAEAVIAHEAAHLRRGDWPRLIAARIVVALFWFNPFIWLLERLHLQDVEEAADAEATCHVEPTHYAQALLNVARKSAGPACANSMASGTISKRIRQVLNRGPRSRWETMWRNGALTSVAMIAVPVVAVQFVAPAVSAAVAAAPAPIASPVVPTVALAPSARAVAAPRAAHPAAVALAAANGPAAVGPETDEIIHREALDRAVRAGAEARAQAAIAVRSVDVAKIQARVAASMSGMREGMLRGAEGMERGAIAMREGAAKMREEARKLHDPAYRAEQIRKARARGDDVPTDQELIDAIPKMEDGARKMDAGVDEMRRGAQRMREQARRQD